MWKILYLENDPEVAAPLLDQFLGQGWNVRFVQEGLEALVLGVTQSFDVALLDLDVMDIAPLQLVRYLRNQSKEMLILGTSKLVSPEEQVRWKQAGVSEALTKPLVTEGLTRRFATHLEKVPPRNRIPQHDPWAQPPHSDLIRLADVVLNLQTCSVHRGGQEFDLSPREMQLLEFMMRNPNSTLSKELLLKEIWNCPSRDDSRVVENCIARLRKKVDKPFRYLRHPRIQTHRPGGYCFRTT